MTLVGQGLNLFPLICRLGVAADNTDAREERLARFTVARAAVAWLQV
jgi:hypothetical protein